MTSTGQGQGRGLGLDSWGACFRVGSLAPRGQLSSVSSGSCPQTPLGLLEPWTWSPLPSSWPRAQCPRPTPSWNAKDPAPPSAPAGARCPRLLLIPSRAWSLSLQTRTSPPPPGHPPSTGPPLSRALRGLSYTCTQASAADGLCGLRVHRKRTLVACLTAEWGQHACTACVPAAACGLQGLTPLWPEPPRRGQSAPVQGS